MQFWFITFIPKHLNTATCETVILSRILVSRHTQINWSSVTVDTALMNESINTYLRHTSKSLLILFYLSLMECLYLMNVTTFGHVGCGSSEYSMTTTMMMIIITEYFVRYGILRKRGTTMM